MYPEKLLLLITRAVLFLIAVLLAYPLRVHAPAVGLDASWAVALNDAATRGLVHGRDIAFTYGPWAWVALPMGANIDAAVKWQCAMWAVYAGALGYLFFYRNIGLLNLALFTACVFQGARTFVDYGYAGPDIFLAFTVLLLLVCAADSMYWLLFLCCAVALTGVLFLIKLTAGIFAASAIVVWAVATRRPIGIAAAVCGIPAALATAFFLHHPSLDVLGQYVRAALEISSGFSVAMSSPGETTADLRDAALLFVGFIALAAVLAWRKQDKAFAIALSLAGPLFLSFKHSFIRPAGHMEILFTTAPLLLAVVVLAADFEGRKNWPLIAVVAALAVVWVPRSGTLAVRPWPALSVASSDALAPDRIEGLPRVPTAVFPYEAAIPIASRVESRPFPVIQAYQSYTRWLDAWNAQSITNAQQIVVHWDVVDGRHPFLDAPALTLAMMQHYDFAQELGPRILLKRRDTPRFRAIRKTGQAVLKLGETLMMPASTKPQLMRVDLKLNLHGQIRKLLWKLPEARVLLSAPGGRVLAARLVPDVLGNPGGLSFMPTSLDDLRRMLEKGILADPYNEIVINADYYESEAKVEYFEIDDWAGVSLERDAAAPDFSKLLNQGEARAAKIDSVNDVGVASIGANEVAEIPAAGGFVIVKGWAFDFSERKPASAVYLQVDKIFVKTTYGQSRMDNVALFDHNYALAPTGFSAAIPKSRLGAGDVHELRLVVASADGRKYATGMQRVRFRAR